MCLQLRMFVHFFFNPLVCVLQSVSLSLTLLFVFVSLSVYLLWQARRTSGVDFVWFRASSGFMSVTVSMARGMALIRKHMKLTKFGKVPQPNLSK